MSLNRTNEEYNPLRDLVIGTSILIVSSAALAGSVRFIQSRPPIDALDEATKITYMELMQQSSDLKREIKVLKRGLEDRTGSNQLEFQNKKKSLAETNLKIRSIEIENSRYSNLKLSRNYMIGCAGASLFTGLCGLYGCLTTLREIPKYLRGKRR